jgi:hypothetical protein
MAIHTGINDSYFKRPPIFTKTRCISEFVR